MNKKWGIVLGAVMAVSLVALSVVGAAWAQGTTSSQARPQSQAGPPGRGPGGGMDEIAKLLGMTSDQIWAERVLGKTIADLATDKGVDTLQLVDALPASQKTMLDQAVTESRLTQAQADKWLAWYKQMAALQLGPMIARSLDLEGMRQATP
jgi:hypothetical protein